MAKSKCSVPWIGEMERALFLRVRRMQTDATTPNVVAPTMLGVVACVLVVVWGLQCIVGRIQPISLCKPCVMSVRGTNNVGRPVRKTCANGSNIVALRSSDHGTKEMLGVVGWKVWPVQTLRNNTQQHPTTCNRVCKRTQHVTSNNVGSCWPTVLRSLARGLRLHANGRNNSQHCCANNVGSCCVRVGNGVQKDATTPKNVGTYSASWEGYNL